MDKFSVYVPKLLPRQEKYRSGRRSCKGCGKAMSARLASKTLRDSASFPEALEPNLSTSVLSFGSYSCAHDDIGAENIITNLLSRVASVNREARPASRTARPLLKKAVIGVDRRVLKSEFLDLTLALQHSQPALYLCFDNDTHMNDFIWRTAPQAFVLNESFHPPTTADVAQTLQEKNRPSIVKEADFSYFATACPSLPFDLMSKINKGVEVAGNAFVLVLTPCPTGWMFPSAQSADIGTSAVQTGYFPLYEKAGDTLNITGPVAKLRPLPEFISKQKRFMTFPPALIPALQGAVEAFYADLIKKSRGA